MMKNNNPNISVIGTVAGRGGLETVLTHVLTSSIINRDLNISFFIFRKVEFKDFFANLKDVKVYQTNLTNNLLCLLRLMIFLVFFQGDAVVIMTPNIIPVANLIKKIFLKRYRIISWMHNSNQDQALDYTKLNKAEDHLAISNEIKQEIVNEGVAPEQIKVIFNPIKPEQRTILPLENECRFIYISRILLDGQKNLRGLLNCLSNLSGKWTFEIYGKGPDFAEAQRLVEQKPNLKDKVIFKGWVSDPWKQIKNANALLLNSNYEGFGMVLAEAMSYGVPCISSDCVAGPSDIIKQGVNGFLYPVNDEEALHVYLQKFVSHQVNFDSQTVKSSIDFLYENQYDERFVKVIEDFLK
ncbi:glycosyltransferase [Fructilactobacillus sanfranciscensis]|uniref:glycosyltransferase n=1 Tax=Fructilactobacillus sanfranciscensis TaxID=1625 RepID=UPI0023AA3575|nr:glycosyltransferase [Fructilactobacillus sanfranciscensis]WED57328.1 glycosyltransferase [Fructilactobacillus sanfranciscensis]